jgi:uncharacterized membrane protein YgdD (TMEM256/DUF423 family)
VLFSCSIFAFVLTGAPAFQFLTPFGGMSYMAGWAVIGVYYAARAARGGPSSAA